METGKDIYSAAISDPSSLTTAQLLREISSLKELMSTEINGIKEAIKIAHDDLVRVPTDVQKQVGALKELLETKIDTTNKLKEEKFTKVEQRFDLIEKQRLEQKNDTAEGVRAAFESARSLFELQNLSFTKQVDQMQAFIQVNIKSLDEKIGENKDKIIRIESIAAGAITGKIEQREVVHERQAISSSTWGIIAVVSSIILGILGLVVGYVISKG